MEHWKTKCKNNRNRKKKKMLGSGGTRLYSQHVGGRGKWISKIEASLVYKSELQNSQGYTENPVSKNQKKKKKTTKKEEKKESKREKEKKKKTSNSKAMKKCSKNKQKIFPKLKRQITVNYNTHGA